MKRRPPNWSKLLTVCILAPFLGVIGLAAALAIGMYRADQADASVALMQALLAFVAAPSAVAIGFYFWKAKAENLVKLARILKINEIDNDIAARVIDADEIKGA